MEGGRKPVRAGETLKSGMRVLPQVIVAPSPAVLLVQYNLPPEQIAAASLLAQRIPSEQALDVALDLHGTGEAAQNQRPPLSEVLPLGYFAI